MKILINAISAKCGGAKTIIEEIYEKLEEDENEYYILCHKGTLIDKGKSNVFIEETFVGEMNYVLRFFWYQLMFNKYILKKKYDVCLNLTNYGPIKCVVPQILLLHNAKHVSEEIRNEYSIIKKIKSNIEDIVLKISLLGADKLIVQTDYMKNRVIEKYKYSNDNIFVIPNVVKNSKKNYEKISEEIITKIDDFKKDKKCIISCITLFTNYKNLYLLIDAVESLVQSGENIGLLLTISENEGENARKFIKFLNQKNIEKNIISLGNINKDEVNYILEKSDVFCYPSFMESQGIPFIEAMRKGVPIIASDLEFAHNVCGDAAEYFKYNSIESLIEKIRILSNNDKFRKCLIENSQKRYNELSKIDFVKEYINICRDLYIQKAGD